VSKRPELPSRHSGYSPLAWLNTTRHVDDSHRLPRSPVAMALAGSSGVKVETVADPIVET